MAKVLYVRHGQTLANVKRVFAGGGPDKSTLTEEGIRQAHQLGKELRSTHITKIICSPTERTFDTAMIIAEYTGFDSNKIIKDPRIKEYDTGEYKGMPTEGMTAERLIVGKGAEDPREFAKRVHDFLKDVSKYDGVTLVVGHAATAKMIDCLRTGRNPANFFDTPKKPNARAFELDLSWLDSSD